MPTIKAQHVSLKNIAVLFAAIGGAASLVMGSVKFIVGAADVRYPLRTEYSSYQQGQALSDTLRESRHEEELRDIHATIARMDTNVACLRHPRKKMCE